MSYSCRVVWLQGPLAVPCALKFRAAIAFHLEGMAADEERKPVLALGVAGPNV
jgi:hypothetical protein